jgi:hypothetical protein
VAETNLFRLFLSPLEKSGFHYMVTGAAASIVYGEPRLTHDIDLVIELHGQDAGRIAQAFPADQFYCPPVEVLEEESKRSQRGHFNVIHLASGFKADFYLKGQDELHRWAMANRRRVKMEGLSIWIAPPEYVIVRKLEYYRQGGSEKHIRDIAGMMAISPEQIDLKILFEKIEEFDLGQEWEKVHQLKDL